MISTLFTIFRNRVFRLKGMILKAVFIMLGCKVGRGLKCKGFPIFRTFPRSNFYIGDNVNIGYRITFDVASSGELILHDNVNLTQDIIISAIERVDIGDKALVAEHVSIRDGDHQFSANEEIVRQPLSGQAVSIGNDVWIGAGVRVLKGSRVSSGCVVASNSVITKNVQMDEGGIYAGIPATKIGER
ncbi:acyltransferase [Halioglobus maricola]|uniref:Acyltransferase n=1 Tax=Halioglobus maricola TaxID=2601894 RepID=A0A5P9NFR0_9GAMM|nr:acyltransferase [Halioglobus maricola]QFU74611.1 acyltransferase [Halioglobus maricola]